MAKEGWRPGLKDAEFFLACDPTAAFVGELNGKPIATVRISKYGDSFAFIGAYLVDKAYRGKGYGLKIFNAAVSSVKPTSNIGLYALLHLEKMYERSGFRSHFHATRYDFHLPRKLPHWFAWMPYQSWGWNLEKSFREERCLIWCIC